MCGIWFYANPTKPEDARSAARREDFFRLAHRGPDYSHYQVYPAAGMAIGFHRLAIVRPGVKGHQPFVREIGGRTVILMCNGEIYNWKELCAGGVDRLGSDCEVLMELYLRGRHLFLHAVEHQVKGEFAFVLVELDALGAVSFVMAGRDKVGVRPLYVSTGSAGSGSDGSGSAGSGSDASDGLLLTSELKGAMSYPGPMRELPPGEVWTWSAGMEGLFLLAKHEMTTRLYNTATLPVEEGERDKKGLLFGVQDAAVAAVRRRLEADRPLTFLLSGGVDSSLVAALGARLLGRPIRTFCCGLQVDGVAVGRDLEYAREVAEWIGSDHTEVLFTKEEALAAIPDVVRTVESWDTTTVRASVGQYLVCRWIGQNTDGRVVMVGEGPDEVCSSYLFNWYAPSGEALDESAREYVRRIHLYDARRADRCIARWGLEARVPFLDPEFIQAYWRIPGEWRMPAWRGIEKWWLREAFRPSGSSRGLLPERVRVRTKDAFSDSISGQVSWTTMIQQWIEETGIVTDEEMAGAAETYPYQTPATKEAYWYRRLFCEVVGAERQDVLPGYWQPRWNAAGEVHGYVDPSARTLGVYETLVTPL